MILFRFSLLKILVVFSFLILNPIFAGSAKTINEIREENIKLKL